MSYTLINIEKYLNYAKDYKSAAELIKYISADIWNRIGFVNNCSSEEFLRIYEVTITQNLIYEIYKFQKVNKLNLIQIQESKNERTNGSDLLLCVLFDRGVLQIPIQAKIMSANKENDDGIYKYFHHKNKSGIQIDLLENYAQMLGSNLAIYLFYNFTNGSSYIDKNEQEHLYGCSFTATKNLFELKDSQKLYFSSIHPNICKPFYHFFQDGGRFTIGNSSGNSPTGTMDDVIDFYKLAGLDIDKSFVEQLHFYNIEEIYGDDSWGNVNSIDNVNKDNNVFNPKYRMLVGMPQKGDENQALQKEVVYSPSLNAFA